MTLTWLVYYSCLAGRAIFVSASCIVNFMLFFSGVVMLCPKFPPLVICLINILRTGNWALQYQKWHAYNNHRLTLIIWKEWTRRSIFLFWSNVTTYPHMGKSITGFTNALFYGQYKCCRGLNNVTILQDKMFLRLYPNNNKVWLFNLCFFNFSFSSICPHFLIWAIHNIRWRYNKIRLCGRNHWVMIARQAVDVLLRFKPQQSSTLLIFLLLPR